MSIEGTIKPLVFESADAVSFRQKDDHTTSQERESQQIQQDIQNEVDVLKFVQHSHVVRLITTYIHREAYLSAYAMIIEPVADLDLEHYLHLANEKDREHERKILKRFGCLVNGLAYLHENNIVHRDIKPHNILIKDNCIFFTDFGISVLRDTDLTISTTITDSPRSRTPAYCAPEVDQGHTRGRSADIFSLGAVWLEMLAVTCGPGHLEKLRESLLWYGRKSFSKNGEKALQSFSRTEETLDADPGRSTIFSLCAFMLNVSREKRPSADEVASCWLYRPFLPVPPASSDCHSCSRLHSDSKEVNEALLDAVQRRHMVPLLLLLDRRVDINIKGQKGYTSLHLAAENGDIEIMQQLLERGVMSKLKSEDGSTPLMLAARGGHEDAVYMLVSKDEYKTQLRDGDGYIDALQAQSLRAIGGSAEEILKLREQVKQLQQELEFQKECFYARENELIMKMARMSWKFEKEKAQRDKQLRLSLSLQSTEERFDREPMPWGR